MSDNPKVSYAVALQEAERIKDNLAPYCEKIEIAGSIRRKKAQVGDIEIVLIPKAVVVDLFGRKNYDLGSLFSAVPDLDYEFIKGGRKYRQYVHRGSRLHLDLFITTPNQWGLIFAIRTGSAQFSHWLVTKKRYGGALPSNYLIKDGFLFDQAGEVIPCTTEKEFFENIQISYIPPEQRNEQGTSCTWK